MIKRRKSHSSGQKCVPSTWEQPGQQLAPTRLFLEEEVRPMWLEHEGKGVGAKRQVGQTTWGLKPSRFLLKAGRHIGGLCRAGICSGTCSGVTVCWVVSGRGWVRVAEGCHTGWPVRGGVVPALGWASGHWRV